VIASAPAVIGALECLEIAGCALQRLFSWNPAQHQEQKP